MIKKILLLAVFAIFSTGCSTHLGHLKPEQSSFHTDAPEGENLLSIQYIGVGGHIFRFRGSAIMTGASITNPHFLLLGPFMPISTDKELVDKYLPDVSDVESILIGHAHYDHLMDTPYIMQEKALNSHVYGSNTTAHIMAAAVDKSRIHGLNDRMATNEKVGEWIYNAEKTIRFMPIEGAHAPHFMGIKFMGGTYDEDLEELPWHSFGWKEGQTLSYLIDFLGEQGEVLHRVYYQDSASEEPKGLIPPLPAADQKRVDIAILCPASFNQIENYPESVMENTNARNYILGHWEDFFDNQEEEEQRFVRATDPDDFFARFHSARSEDSGWVLPAMYSTHYYAPHGKKLK